MSPKNAIYTNEYRSLTEDVDGAEFESRSRFYDMPPPRHSSELEGHQWKHKPGTYNTKKEFDSCLKK